MQQDIRSERVLLSTSEAMQMSGLSREHIQRLLREGRIEGRKPGHDWLVYEDSLKSFLAQPRKPGPKGARKPPSDQNSHTMSTISDGDDAQDGKV
jgi:excisionase family DNA binding protein